MPQKKGMGAMTEEEVQTRMNKLVGIIMQEVQKEINQIFAEGDEDIDEMKKAMIAEPKEIIDEWVEKLRAFTERQTKIHCARLRRIEKLRILEAYGNIRENVKNEAREMIKTKMSAKSAESDKILRDLLLQGLLRIMESTVLVHTTKADLERVSKQYDSVTKKYRELTGREVKLMTSRHPLKEKYFGRIVLSDKNSVLFVDMNLFDTVDQVADKVFSHYAAYHDKVTSKNWGMEALKRKGLEIMPRGPHISTAQLDSILSTLRGDPRSQAPVFHIKEEEKKQEPEEQSVDTKRPSTSLSEGAKPRNQALRARKVTISEKLLPMRASLSLTEPGSFMSSVYGGYFYSPEQDGDDQSRARNSEDLYNLEMASSIDIAGSNSQPILELRSSSKDRPFLVVKRTAAGVETKTPQMGVRIQQPEEMSVISGDSDIASDPSSQQYDSETLRNAALKSNKDKTEGK